MKLYIVLFKNPNHTNTIHLLMALCEHVLILVTIYPNTMENMCANYLFFYYCYLLPPDACVWLQGNNVDGSAGCLCVLIITNISVSLVIISVVSLKCFCISVVFML